jgi:signal transduction histidine kinase
MRCKPERLASTGQSRQGELLGVLSAHFRNPHRPPERALRMVDLYARQAAEFLERMKIEASLKEADRRKSDFLAILAHELRDPLAPIRNGLRILRSGASANESSQRTLNMMDRQVSHLVHLIDDLRDVSRIARGHVALKREKIVLTDVLANAVEASRPLIEAHAHKLVIDERPPSPSLSMAIPIALRKYFPTCSQTARSIRIAEAPSR